MPLIIVLMVLGILGGGYIGSSQAIGNKPAWRKMVLTPAQYNLRSEVVGFNSIDGVRLKAWWLPAQPSEGVTSSAVAVSSDVTMISVILAHGRDMNRSGMLPRAVFLARQGYNVLDIDLRDHGESGGNYITPGYREALDVMGGVAYIRSFAVPCNFRLTSQFVS